MILTFRPIKVWPADWKPASAGRPSSPFTAAYRDTLSLLDRELSALRASNVVLQVDAAEADVRIDGQLRGNAKVNHPGCILAFDTRKHGLLTYPCDRFERPNYGMGTDLGAAWKHNLRAIALGLEALRKVERYGIAERGQQYAGYRELGAGDPIAVGAAMTVEAAADLLAAESNLAGSGLYLIENRGEVDGYYRAAAKRHHPDVGGDDALFRQLTAARDLLAAHA